jgi:hypothetical protein
MTRRKASVVTQKPAGTEMPSIRDSPPRMRAFATNDRDLRLVNLVKTQHVLLDHCDTSEAAEVTEGNKRPSHHPVTKPDYRKS